VGNLRQLKNKKQVAQMLKKFARGMEILASNKMSLRKRDLEKLSIYQREVQTIVTQAASGILKEELIKLPLISPPAHLPKVVVAFFSDMGLCGSLNQQIADELAKLNISERDYLFVIGGMAENYINEKPDGSLAGMYSDPDYETVSMFFVDILTIPSSRMVAIYFHSEPGREGKAITEDLMPLEIPITGRMGNIEYIPDALSILQKGLENLLFAKLIRIFYQAAFSEFNMRWLAMSRAEKQAEEMIEELTVKIGRIRQESITRELLDVIGVMYLEG